jgi:TfoX/Sxy family transcriptional regulator of competence genes
MSEQQDFATDIVDLLEPFRYCEARRMFGLITDSSLHLKADAESRADFVAEGSSAFGYFTGDREYKLSCYQAPDDFFKDDAACLRRARLAFDSALRNPARHRKKKS